MRSRNSDIGGLACADRSFRPFADDIRYLSLHDNSYLRYFKGHKKKCVLAWLPSK